MQHIIADLLGIDAKDVVSEANFFRDLGGTFDHLKPLRLKTEAAFGIDINAVTNEVNARTAMNAGGLVTTKSLKEIGNYLDLKLGSHPIPFLDLYTVGFIEAITAKAIERRDGAKPSAPADNVQFSQFSRSEEVRKIVGRVLNVPADQLSSDTDLGRTDGLIIAGIISELNARWGIRIDNVLVQVIAASRADKSRNLTEDSRQTLAKMLPGVTFPPSAKVTKAFIDRLGVFEAIVDREASAAEPDKAGQPIFRLPVNLRWTLAEMRALGALHRSLGDQKVRQVLAECARLANVEGTPWHSLVNQCIDAMLRFSATGKGKKELKERTRDLKEWEHEGLPLLRALAAGLRVELPPDILIAAAQVLAVAENLDQKQAVARVQSIAGRVSSEEPPPDAGKAPRKEKQKSLLSRLPKRAQR